MFARSMLDAYGSPLGQAPQVTQWAFDADAGRINAFDGQGRVLMVIATDPAFGPRLAAAFGWPTICPWPRPDAKA